METVAGIFSSRAAAEEAVRQLHSLGVPNDRIALLTPGMNDDRVEKAVPTADSEQPGMGEAMGGTVGGAVGVAGGASLGAAAASLLVPGVGPVIAGGILGAAILGAGGTVAGMAAGEALEKENWWIGLRDVEGAHYASSGRDFQSDEASYRRGFEAACRIRPAAGESAAKLSPDNEADEVYRRGYERGQRYQQRLREKHQA